MRKTKIIATIGPASKKNKILREMHKAGMNIARINTKYCSEKECSEFIEKIKRINNCKIMLDIKEQKKIKWIKNMDFDYIALSYTKNKKRIKEIRKLFLPKKVKIIAKIETKKGIKNIDEIIEESEGLMVARGDLAKNISFEKVPIIQKIILKKEKKKGKFTITATEMLLSLMNSKIPENSEVSDIANAVLDGSDSLMLSEETAIGKYPVLSVKVMNKIIKYIEKNKHKTQ